jgi:hypothetical protein
MTPEYFLETGSTKILLLSGDIVVLKRLLPGQRSIARLCTADSRTVGMSPAEVDELLVALKRINPDSLEPELFYHRSLMYPMCRSTESELVVKLIALLHG